MGYRLTAKERRIIECTRLEGERQTPTPAGGRGRLWRSVLIWVAGIVFFYLLAMLMIWVGSLL